MHCNVYHMGFVIRAEVAGGEHKPKLKALFMTTLSALYMPPSSFNHQMNTVIIICISNNPHTRLNFFSYEPQSFANQPWCETQMEKKAEVWGRSVKGLKFVSISDKPFFTCFTFLQSGLVLEVPQSIRRDAACF